MNYSFRSQSFVKKKILLSNALNWLSEIGVDYFNSRIHKYQNDLSILIDRIDIQDPQSLVDPQFFATMVNSIYESGELIRIHNSLKDLIVTPDLKNKIKVFIKGPEYANDEKPMTGSQQPRDIAFELIIASMFLRAGYKIDFHTTADLRAQNDKSTFFVECKRPRSIHSVRANVRSAASQLRKRYISYSNNDNTVYGIIALSIDMIVNPKNYMLIANDEQAIDNRMIAEAQEFIQNNDMHWKSIPDINTLGILLSLQTVAVPENHNMITECSFIAGNNIVHSQSSQGSIFRNLIETLRNGVIEN